MKTRLTLSPLGLAAAGSFSAAAQGASITHHGASKLLATAPWVPPCGSTERK